MKAIIRIVLSVPVVVCGYITLASFVSLVMLDALIMGIGTAFFVALAFYTNEMLRKW